VSARDTPQLPVQTRALAGPRSVAGTPPPAFASGGGHSLRNLLLPVISASGGALSRFRRQRHARDDL